MIARHLLILIVASCSVNSLVESNRNIETVGKQQSSEANCYNKEDIQAGSCNRSILKITTQDNSTNRLHNNLLFSERVNVVYGNYLFDLRIRIDKGEYAKYILKDEKGSKTMRQKRKEQIQHACRDWV